ncbi:glycerophosphodiester phosphodiesterase [Thalassoroseus pseudoceratinae]|uniref:glycerophosphodiester phosphodiesterase n=1 Tax=Thalassoroseus pseudoceratinae TaxID=2713176 RepID=UPI001422327F|nr:glycerophosphodiester phosphodiesterase family protein [Thalassoroseus pseudoceratinae]
MSVSRCLVPMFLAVFPIESQALAEPLPLMGVQQIVAHRGSSVDRPECTLPAVRRAIAARATAVEVDVRTTQDGHLVILHDATLDRTTNGKGPLREHTLAEVRQLDAGSWFDAEYAGERVPTLQETLIACRDKIDVLLDLKEQGRDFAIAVVAEVKQHGAPERTIVGVRSVEQARLFRQLLPDARQLGLIPNPKAIEPFAEAGVETIRLWPRWLDDDNTLVERVRNTGAALHLNGTTGKREEVLSLLEHSPASLSSDDPGQLLKTLAKLHLDRDKQ